MDLASDASVLSRRYMRGEFVNLIPLEARQIRLAIQNHPRFAPRQPTHHQLQFPPGHNELGSQSHLCPPHHHPSQSSLHFPLQSSLALVASLVSAVGAWDPRLAASSLGPLAALGVRPAPCCLPGSSRRGRAAWWCRPAVCNFHRVRRRRELRQAIREKYDYSIYLTCYLNPFVSEVENHLHV